MASVPYAASGRVLKLLRMDRGWLVEDVYDHILREYGPSYAPPPQRIRAAESGRCRLCIRYEFGLAKAYGKAPSEIWPERTRARARRRQMVAA